MIFGNTLHVRIAAIIVALICCFSGAFGQKLTNVSRTDEKFIKDMTGLLENQRKGLGKEIIEEKLSPIWLNPGKYTADQKTRVYDLIDGLLKNNAKIFPEVSNYALCLVHLATQEIDNIKFDELHTALTKLITDKKNKKFLGEYVECASWMLENKCMYRSSGYYEWRTDGNYHFQFDSIPMIAFDQANFLCMSAGDTMKIESGKGFYAVATGRLIGQGGNVTWARTGLDPKQTYAELKKYNIKLSMSSYEADSVTFHTQMFTQPLKGKLTDKIFTDSKGEKSTYPKFESYSKRMKIQNMEKGIDYEGGFSMWGSKMLGSGTTAEPATLTIYRENKPFLYVKSLDFEIKPNSINAQHASVLFRIEKDSITHHDVSFSFEKTKRELLLIRKDEGASKGPFQNSYHDLDMYFEALYWTIDDPLIRIGAWEGSQARYAAFESSDYFKRKRFEALMGIATSNPLYDIKRCAAQKGSSTFAAMDLALITQLSVEAWTPSLVDLSNKGFIVYDIQNQRVTVLEKLYHYIDNSNGKRDYDIIQFSSEVNSGFNAQLNLINYDLQLKGIDNIYVSDSQAVMIQPANREIIVKKNRDFTFGGRVMAGNFEFLGSEYYFTYDIFKLDLIHVDSARIYVEDYEHLDDYGKPSKLKVKSVIHNIVGDLKIDAPTNKGGVQSRFYPQYPILTTTKSSYVYWQHERIQKGAYKKDQFFYEIDPFSIDSLDNFSKKDLRFQGTLHSGGIFPDIDEPLVLMEDNSLGFRKSTGDAGYAAYNGKAKIVADLKLDYSGLKGGGQFDYLTTTATSNEFTLLPDSMLGITTSYVNKELVGKIEVPKSHCEKTKLNFKAKKDVLEISSVDLPIQFFNDEARLFGTSRLTPKGMKGEGRMEFIGAKLSSEGFDFLRRKILADTSDFQLAREGETDEFALAFKTNNVSANVDFDKRQGVFRSNSGETKIEFPANEYVCYMDQFTWYMDKDELDLSSSRKAKDDLVIDTSEDSKRSNFYSIESSQDSLNFLSPRAKYDIKKGQILCTKIQYIVVADSKITPDSGKVVIEKHAVMQPLTHAKIQANYVTKYHNIFDADVQIKARRNFTGSGKITYIDENKKEQTIALSDIGVDTSYQTVGQGRIKEEDQFFLSPAFEFQGDFKLRASQKFLTFDGGTRILHNCADLPRRYFRFKAEINPNEIYIPVDSLMKDIDYQLVSAGIMMTQDSPINIYPNFLTLITDKEDKSILRATGFLTYDKLSMRYLIGSKEKIKQPKLAGNLLSLSTNACEISGDGQIDFNVDYGMLTLRNVGDVRMAMSSKETTTIGATLINFPFDDGLLKHIHENIEKWPNLMPVDVTKSKYEKVLVEFLGTEKSDKLISELGLYGQLKKVPEELISSFFLADLKLTWNENDQSFQSTGAIGIASIDKKQLFRYVKGKVEIEKKRGADVIRIYLELDPGMWYYFEYKSGLMSVLSSDKDFGTKISEIKDEKRVFEDGKKRFTYQYIVNRKKRDDFVSRFPDLQ